ncbi:hypothetical protein D3C71_1316130 [compost metagenome]
MQIGVGDRNSAGDRAFHHQPQFNFVVEKAHGARLDQVAVSRHQATRRLGEDHVEFLRIRVHARLDHVLTIVGTLAEELLVTGHRRQQFYFALRKLRTFELREVVDTVLANEVTGGFKNTGDDCDTALAKHAPVDTVLKFKADYVYSRH